MESKPAVAKDNNDECAIATSTPRNSDTEHAFNPDHSEVARATQHDNSEDSHKSEISFNLNPMNLNMDSSSAAQFKNSNRSLSRSSSQEEEADLEFKYRSFTRGYRQNSTESKSPIRSPNTSLDMSDIANHSFDTQSDEPMVVNLGPKKENKERYRKDFYVSDTPKVSRKTPPTSPRDVSATSPRTLTPSSPREESHYPIREETPVQVHTEKKVIMISLLNNLTLYDNNF